MKERTSYPYYGGRICAVVGSNQKSDGLKFANVSSYANEMGVTRKMKAFSQLTLSASMGRAFQNPGQQSQYPGFWSEESPQPGQTYGQNIQPTPFPSECQQKNTQGPL